MKNEKSEGGGDLKKLKMFNSPAPPAHLAYPIALFSLLLLPYLYPLRGRGDRPPGSP
jgi:hypothetical protein